MSSRIVTVVELLLHRYLQTIGFLGEGILIDSWLAHVSRESFAGIQ